MKNYDCCHSLTTSDHHPVWASLEIDTRLTNPATKRPAACYLELTDVTGHDLRFVALERETPFLVLYSSAFKSGKLSKRSVVRGQSPKWPDGHIPRLKSIVSSPTVLSLAHLCIAIRDGKNEVAQCVLSLKDACGPYPGEFSVQLVNGGLPAGELRGKMHLKWGGKEGDDEIEDASMMSMISPNNKESSSASLTAAAAPSSVSNGSLTGSGFSSGSGIIGGGSGGVGGGGVLPLDAVLKQGFLLKQGSKVKSWKRRWFVFSGNGELAYYPDRKTQKPLDKLHVDTVAPFSNAGKLNCIAIETGKRRLLFCADNTEDFDGWMAVLSAYCSSQPAPTANEK